MGLADLLVTARTNAGLTQVQLAALAGYSTHTTIASLETGRRRGELATWARVLRPLEVDPGAAVAAAQADGRTLASALPAMMQAMQ